MSEPARIGTWRSATALVRVNRGSTWTSLAPLSLAFMGQRNATGWRSEEHTSELQSRSDLVCRLLLEKKKKTESICQNCAAKRAGIHCGPVHPLLPLPLLEADECVAQLTAARKTPHKCCPEQQCSAST